MISGKNKYFSAQRCGEDIKGGREMNIVAVLSTTVLPLDGVYKVFRVHEAPDIKGVPHYIGHPATKEIVESLGAVQAPTKLFGGLQPGEAAATFAIKQGRSARALNGFSSPHQDVDIDDLDVRILVRLE
jgi:hypothetical protein